jgi:kynureninase
VRNQLVPSATGWAAHRNPFAFAPGPIDYAEDSFRFLNGTPNIPALYSARSGYEIIIQAGVPAIREKSLRQTQYLLDLADEAGLRVSSCRDAHSRGGVVVLDVANGEQVTRELARREILVDYRPQAGIRVAPHFYNSDEELEHIVGEIRSILDNAAKA